MSPGRFPDLMPRPTASCALQLFWTLCEGFTHTHTGPGLITGSAKKMKVYRGLRGPAFGVRGLCLGVGFRASRVSLRYP